MSRDEFRAANRRKWDERVAIHRRDATGFFAVKRFLAGQKWLHAIDSSELGEIAGKRLIHPRCHLSIHGAHSSTRYTMIAAPRRHPMWLLSGRCQRRADVGMSGRECGPTAENVEGYWARPGTRAFGPSTYRRLKTKNPTRGRVRLIREMDPTDGRIATSR